MDGIREYLLRLTAAAVLCGIVTGFLGKKGTLGAIVRLLTGIFMTLTVVSPWTQVRIGDFTDYFDDLSAQAANVSQDGERMAKDAVADIIKAEAEAYILDKANSFGAELTVEVSVDSSDLPVPCAVRINGRISPYGRTQLERIISEELGIALEDQIWTG